MMRNKYFILVLTFLCIIVSQESFGQDYNDNSWDADGDVVGDPLDEVVIVNDYHDSSDDVDPNADLYDPYNYGNEPTPIEDDDPHNDDPVVNPKNPVTPDPEVCTLAVCTTPGYTVDSKLCACVPPPKLWYLDNDGDDYYSAMLFEGQKPSGNYKDTTKGFDCNDNDSTKNTDCGTPIWYFDWDGDGYYSDIQDSDTSPGTNWSLTTKGQDCNDDIYSPNNICDDVDIPCPLTAAELLLAFPNSPVEIREKLAMLLNRYAKSFGIDTKEKMQHFLTQTGHETGGFTKLAREESMYFTPNRLVEVWPNRFSQTDPNKLDPDDYARSTEKLANYVYGGRNGNTEPGDGYEYRGRGLIQITGKTKYEDFGEYYSTNFDSSVDLLKNPSLVGTNDNIAVLSALWYFQKNILDVININANTTVDKVTLQVNPLEVAKIKKLRRDLFNDKIKPNIDCK